MSHAVRGRLTSSQGGAGLGHAGAIRGRPYLREPHSACYRDPDDPEAGELDLDQLINGDQFQEKQKREPLFRNIPRDQLAK